MPFLRTRRVLLAAACVTSLFVAACGGTSTVVSAFTPARVVSSAGEVGNAVTGGMARQLALRYGAASVTVPGPASGLALGSARAAATPNAAGDATAPTVASQVDAMLAAGVSGDNTLVVIAAGLGDIVFEANRVVANTQTVGQATTNVRGAANAYAGQVRRLVAAGAKRVAMAGTWNLGRSPWAATVGAPLLQDLSRAFNEQLLISTADLGSNVLYIDAELFMNLVTGAPGAYGIADTSSALCTTVDAGPGIGTGTGQVNAALCTTATLAPGLDPARTLFADRLTFTAAGNTLLGNYAYDRVRSRW